MTDILFLPGAAGAPDFWQGVGQRLPAAWNKTSLAWPGLGDQPRDPAEDGPNSLSDLVALAERALLRPSVVAAQSMGGAVALRLALRRPDLVTRLVLAATSGGLDMQRFGAADWRPAFRATFPNSAPWIYDGFPDLTPELHRVSQPTLLLWGEADPISPPAVGEELLRLLPNARLTVIPDGVHAFARENPAAVAPLIEAFLAEETQAHA